MDKLSEGAYVSRAGFKLEQANNKFKVNFKNQSVLDVGSSTGGFSDYAIKHGAKNVLAIELGTNQMDSQLRANEKLELLEKTDILNVKPSFVPDVVLVDLSFVSLKKILPHIHGLVDRNSKIIVLVKPQFEAKSSDKQNGIIKNNSIRRSVLKDFENWSRKYFVILNKTDEIISGTKGNKERFYLLIKA